MGGRAEEIANGCFTKMDVMDGSGSYSQSGNDHGILPPSVAGVVLVTADPTATPIVWTSQCLIPCSRTSSTRPLIAHLMSQLDQKNPPESAFISLVCKPLAAGARVVLGIGKVAPDVVVGLPKPSLSTQEIIEAISSMGTAEGLLALEAPDGPGVVPPLTRSQTSLVS
uniref:Uncharacterized protein n=1 Tax=Amphimedon queenslandica TaxID=400682 RepID=A0A1X7STS2_AMPQE